MQTQPTIGFLRALLKLRVGCSAITILAASHSAELYAKTGKEEEERQAATSRSSDLGSLEMMDGAITSETSYQIPHSTVLQSLQTDAVV